jgi:hypothetical protein
MTEQFILNFLRELWFSELDDNYRNWAFACNLNGYKVTSDWSDGMPVLVKMQ